MNNKALRTICWALSFTPVLAYVLLFVNIPKNATLELFGNTISVSRMDLTMLGIVCMGMLGNMMLMGFGKWQPHLPNNTKQNIALLSQLRFLPLFFSALRVAFVLALDSLAAYIIFMVAGVDENALSITLRIVMLLTGGVFVSVGVLQHYVEKGEVALIEPRTEKEKAHKKAWEDAQKVAGITAALGGAAMALLSVYPPAGAIYYFFALIVVTCLIPLVFYSFRKKAR